MIALYFVVLIILFPNLLLFDKFLFFSPNSIIIFFKNLNDERLGIYVLFFIKLFCSFLLSKFIN